MNIVRLRALPSQKFTQNFADPTLDFGSRTVVFVIAFNRILDRWTATAWYEGETCPIYAGRVINIGVNLADAIKTTEAMVWVSRGGSGNGYALAIETLPDGLPAQFFLKGVPESAVQSLCYRPLA